MSELTYPEFLRLATLRLAAGEDVPIDDSWRVLEESLVLDQDFDVAADSLFSFAAHRRAGVRVAGVARTGEVVQLRLGPLASPCLILVAERSADRAVLVYGTLPGHVERGEEAFIIERVGSQVVGRSVAFSQHAWWLARLAAPFARMVQTWVTRRYLRGMGATP